MRCTDFEKQFLLEGGICSQPQWEHYASCVQCRQYVKAHEMLLPATVPTPSAELDARICRLAVSAMQRQRGERRWRQWTLPLARLAAALALCFGLWYFLGDHSNTNESDANMSADDTVVLATVTDDPWLMQWALACSELDDLEIDLTLHTTMAGNWNAKIEQSYAPMATDALQNLSDELMMLEFDVYENL